MTGPDQNRIATYLDPDIYVTLRRRAMVTGEPLQLLVHEAVNEAREADVGDRSCFAQRAGESTRPFDEFRSEMADAEGG